MIKQQEHTEHEALPGYKTALFVVAIISIVYLILTFVM